MYWYLSGLKSGDNDLLTVTHIECANGDRLPVNEPEQYVMMEPAVTSCDPETVC
jgi:hypothetical protein